MEIPFVGTMDRPILAPNKGCSDDGIWIEVHWEMIKKKNLAIISTVKGPMCLSLKTIHDPPQNVAEVFYYPANMANTYFKVNFMKNHHFFAKH